MIYKTGNLLAALSPSNVVMHGCNQQGVWGSGVAKMMKDRLPEAFVQYSLDIKNGMQLGQVSFFETINCSAVMSAITQRYYGRDPDVRYVSYDAIDSCFKHAIRYCKGTDRELHLPDLIGAGLGNGDYNVITKIIEANARKHSYNTDKIVIWSYRV